MDDLRHDAVTDGAADALLSRRTINLGAAWSVPVVLAAVAAPAAAGSSTPSASFGTISAEKGEAVGSNRQVVFTLVFTDVVGDNKIAITGLSIGGPWQSLPTPEVTVTSDNTAAIFTLLRPDNNASLQNVTVTYTINGVAGTTTVTVKNQVPKG